MATKKRGRGRPPRKDKAPVKILTLLLPISPPTTLKRAIKEKDILPNATKALKELGVIPIK